MVEELKGYMSEVEPLLAQYEAKAAEAQAAWESDNAKKLQKANKKGDGKVAEIEFPVVEFQKAGLAAALSKVEPLLAELGEEMQSRVALVKAALPAPLDDPASLRMSDLRRALGQMLQVMVMSDTHSSEDETHGANASLLMLQKSCRLSHRHGNTKRNWIERGLMN
eukprot:SAG11_NODE_9434_length_912_cov_0.885609_1_plen_166_part_00